MTRDELIESLAEKEHASWARWMQYFLFTKCRLNADDDLTVPASYAEALQKQIDTPYAELSEQEKQFDRDEVAHILPIIDQYANEKLVNATVKTISRGGLVNPIGRSPLQGE